MTNNKQFVQDQQFLVGAKETYDRLIRAALREKRDEDVAFLLELRDSTFVRVHLKKGHK